MDNKYWSDLNKYPPLEKEEEQRVMLKAKAGDRKSYTKLINSNLRFVVSVAKEYQHQGIELEELVSYGNLGLCVAFDKFDPSKGLKFITYAVWWIRQKILHALSEDNHLVKIPHHHRVSVRQRMQTKDMMEKREQREVSDNEVDEELGVTSGKGTIETYYVLPLDKPHSADNDSSLMSILADESAVNPATQNDKESFMKDLDEILKDFTERERAIVKYYHGIDVVRSMTLEEIGVEFGITRERVRQIKLKVLEKLRHKSRKGILQPYLATLQSEYLNDTSSTDD